MDKYRYVLDNNVLVWNKIQLLSFLQFMGLHKIQELTTCNSLLEILCATPALQCKSVITFIVSKATNSCSMMIGGNGGGAGRQDTMTPSWKATWQERT